MGTKQFGWMSCSLSSLRLPHSAVCCLFPLSLVNPYGPDSHADVMAEYERRRTVDPDLSALGYKQAALLPQHPHLLDIQFGRLAEQGRVRVTTCVLGVDCSALTGGARKVARHPCPDVLSAVSLQVHPREPLAPDASKLFSFERSIFLIFEYFKCAVLFQI